MMVNLAIPPETAYTDIERDLIDNEPPGLFPGDQISVWGQVRKVFADYMQYNLADVLNEWYMNLDPRTVALGDVPEWEYMLDTPENSALSLASRQAFLVSRREQGAFTRARRRRLVEAFITATFGPATDFTSDGLPFDSSGITLYSGSTSLAGTYAIREPMDNMVPNPSFETDASLWSANTGTIVRSTAAAKDGAASALVTCNNNVETWVNPSTIIVPIAGKAYSASAWVRRITGSRTCHIQIWFADENWNNVGPAWNGPDVLVSTSAFTQLKIENIVCPPGATRFLVIVDFIGGTAANGDSFYLDAVQLERGSVIHPYLAPGANPFSYDVRILDTITVDLAGLTRELARITPSGITFTITPTPTP